MLRAVLAFVLVATETAIIAADEPRHVGDYGDAERLQLNGAETFTPEQLREALAGDLEFQRAARPSAPFRGLPQLVAARLAEGYRKAGFPDVAVDCQFNEQAHALEVEINEGPRYRCGQIVLKGIQAVSAAQLRRWLLEPQPPHDRLIQDVDGEDADEDEEETEPAWQPGEPAAFTSGAAKTLSGSVDEALADQGYFFARQSTRVVPDPASGTAVLEVTLEDEGPPGLVESIEVTGTRTNSRQQVLDFLEIEPGVQFTRQLQAQLVQRLQRSARFWDLQVQAQPPTEPGGGVRLNIQVVELEGAPSLAEPLSEVQRAALKLCDWLNGLPESDEELVIDAAWPDPVPGRVHAVLAPSRGWILRTRGELATGQAWDYAAMAAFGENGIYSISNRRKLAVTDVPFTAKLQLNTAPRFDKAKVEWLTNLTFGAGVSSRDEDDPPGEVVEPDFSFQAVTFLREVVRAPEAWTVRDGVLRFEREGMLLLVDAESGRLRELRVEAGGGAAAPQDAVHVRTAAGALQREVAALRAECREFADALDTDAPLSSLAGFIIGEAAALSAGAGADDDGIQLREHLELLRLVCAGLDELADDETDEDAEKFHIPVDFAPSDNPLRYAVGLVPSGADALFRRGSWPWTLSREAAFALGDGVSVGLATELGRVHREEQLGPIGDYAMALLGGFVREELAATYATRGLRKLDGDGFRHDARELLSGPLSQQLVQSLVGKLRELDDEQFELLAELVPDEWQPLAAAVRQHVRGDRDTGPMEAMVNVLAVSWQQVWREQARGQFAADRRAAAVAAKVVAASDRRVVARPVAALLLAQAPDDDHAGHADQHAGQ